MNKSYLNTLTVSVVILFGHNILSAQTSPIQIEATGARPLLAALSELEERSKIALNYEDVRFENSHDLSDVTETSSLGPAQREMAIKNGLSYLQIVPKGGNFMYSLLVDPKSGKISDFEAVKGSIESILISYRGARDLPGNFRAEYHDGSIFVGPSESRLSSGQIVPARPVLSTPINFPTATRSGAETLQLILTQVCAAVNFRVEAGMVPVRALTMSQVTMGATNEAASVVLERLLIAIQHSNSAPTGGGPTASFRLLFDPQLKWYMLSMHPISVADIAPSSQAISKPVPQGAPTRNPLNWLVKTP